MTLKWKVFAWNALFLLMASVVSAGTKQPLLLVLFVPQDRAPIPGYVERLDRVMTEVQKFYRDGMQAAGYGPLTFELPRDSTGNLVVHLVQGRSAMAAYGRNDSDKVRSEVESALAAQDIGLQHRTLVIFQVLLKWENGRAVEVGPYVGGGSHLEGTAWVYDDALLDPRQFGSKAPGGFYGRPCSVGEFNSHYIGGVAHELGHGLGLPHVAGPRSERKHSLMGDGNHTYGEELRGEGAGTYLHPASAMLLARCRPFAGALENAEQEAESNLSDLETTFQNGRIVLKGKVEARPSAFGVVAYNDRAAIEGDYDATGWVSAVDHSGQFRLEVGDLEPGAYELRLQVCHTNGASHTTGFNYEVNASRVPDLRAFSVRPVLFRRAIQAFSRGDMATASARLSELERQSVLSEELKEQVAHLRNLIKGKPLAALSSIPPSQQEVLLSDAVATQESVGWGAPLRDRVLVENDATCFLQVDGRFHAHGLFAHAPARHAWALGGAWNTLQGAYGLQDGHEGSVVFVVRGDERELFRSKPLRDHKLHPLEMSVDGVKNLELVVEDAGDGATSDWGVWLEPRLTRTVSLR